MLVWLGDFNYRVDAEYGEAKSLVRRNDLSPLLSKVPQHSLPLFQLCTFGLAVDFSTHTDGLTSMDPVFPGAM